MSSLFGKRKRKRRTVSKNEKVHGPNKTDLLELRYTCKDIQCRTFDASNEQHATSYATSFSALGLDETLVHTCRLLGMNRPTPVQRTVIPVLLHNRNHHLLALAPTGSGKTAAFCLPILQHLSYDPYGVFAVVLTPTRELATQIHQSILALAGGGNTVSHKQSVLVVGGLDSVRQSCAIAEHRPYFVVATPGRLASLLRGPQPRPPVGMARYLVLDEADRLLVQDSGFRRDVAEIVLQCGKQHTEREDSKHACQTLLFSATMTHSLSQIQEFCQSGRSRLPLKKFVIEQDGSSCEVKKEAESSKKDSDCSENHDDEERQSKATIPKIPEGLTQEYLFMPARVRDAYLITVIRTLMAHGGKSTETIAAEEMQQRKRTGQHSRPKANIDKNINKRGNAEVAEVDGDSRKARSAIVFVATCERAALVSGLLEELGVANVALHSLLSQGRRLASLAKFKSLHVRVLVATDVASRGLDVPTVDLVINASLPRSPVAYVHRVGRTARAGRRGRAVSLVADSEIALVHAAEAASGRELVQCMDVKQEDVLPLLGSVAKASRVTKLKLMDIGFDELVQKFQERKVRDRKDRERIDRALANLGNK